MHFFSLFSHNAFLKEMHQTLISPRMMPRVNEIVLDSRLNQCLNNKLTQTHHKVGLKPKKKKRELSTTQSTPYDHQT